MRPEAARLVTWTSTPTEAFDAIEAEMETATTAGAVVAEEVLEAEP